MRLAHSGKDWIFVSDAHFTGRESGEMEPFLRFLDAEKPRMGFLVILGDLFEFFFGFTRTPLPFPDYLPVLKGLCALCRQGIGIKYFEGNHDFSLQPFFRHHFGIPVEVYPEGKEEELGEWRTFIAHGDLSSQKTWRERIFRRVLKNRFTYYFIRLAGPGFSRRVARKLSDRSYRKFHLQAPSVSPPAFKAFAHHKFHEGFAAVILGHSHFPEKAEEWVNGRRCLYFNVGDWKDHRSYLRYTPPDHFQLERYEG